MAIEAAVSKDGFSIPVSITVTFNGSPFHLTKL